MSRRVDPALRQQAAAPDDHVPSVDTPRDAAAGQALECLDRPEPQLVALRPGDDRRPERVLARAFE
jgi:hypothetical protein